MCNELFCCIILCAVCFAFLVQTFFSNLTECLTLEQISLYLQSLTFCSLWPTYMFSSSGPLTERKLRPHCVATAFASNVLPVPGGPCSNSPDTIQYRIIFTTLSQQNSGLVLDQFYRFSAVSSGNVNQEDILVLSTMSLLSTDVRYWYQRVQSNIEWPLEAHK